MKNCKILRRISALALMLVILVCQLPMMASAATDSTDFSSLVTEHVASKGEAIDKPMATYQWLYGDIDNAEAELKPFVNSYGEGTGEWYDALFDDQSANVDGSQNGLWRWQWRCCGAAETILKITAKEDLVMEVYTVETFSDAWATHSAFRFIGEDSEGLRMVVRRMDVTVVMEPDYCKTVVHMAKGDTLYIAYSIMNGDNGTATATYIPQFSLNTEGYDAAQRPAYETVNAVNKLKEDTVKKLEDKYTEMIGDGSAYSTSRQIELEGIKDEALLDLPNLSTEDEVNALYNATVAKMEAVPSLAKEAEELNNYKTEQKNKLAEEFKQEMYSKKNWELVQGYLTQANTDIDAAKNAAVVNTVVAKAKANINTVEKGGEDFTPWIIAGAAVLVVIIVAVVVIVVVAKKSKKN